VTPEERQQYWTAIERIPLFFERETSDGEAQIRRTFDNQPVRVTKPEYFNSEDERIAAIAFYRALYAPLKN